MTFKQQLIEQSKRPQHLERLQKDIEFIKSEMMKSSGAKEYTIYLTKRDTTQDGIGHYGRVTLRIPYGVDFDIYYKDMLKAIKELGFVDKDIKVTYEDIFYRIQINW